MYVMYSYHKINNYNHIKIIKIIKVNNTIQSLNQHYVCISVYMICVLLLLKRFVNIVWELILILAYYAEQISILNILKNI